MAATPGSSLSSRPHVLRGMSWAILGAAVLVVSAQPAAAHEVGPVEVVEELTGGGKLKVTIEYTVPSIPVPESSPLGPQLAEFSMCQALPTGVVCIMFGPCADYMLSGAEFELTTNPYPYVELAAYQGSAGAYAGFCALIKGS